MAVISLDGVRARFLDLLASLGRATVNAQYPDEFEYYAMMLELRNSDNRVEDIFVFPILPDSISIVNNNITNIKKTATGVVSLITPTFVPIDISINGNFGRKFRVLQGSNILSGVAFQFSLATLISAANKKGKEFSTEVKTGYGATKVLERIYLKHTSLDSKGLPYKLFFYNLAFNNIFLVEGMSLKVNQSVGEKNMIWGYDLSMKAIAYANTIIDTSSSIKNLIRQDIFNKTANIVSTTIKETINITTGLLVDKLQTSKDKLSDYKRKAILTL